MKYILLPAIMLLCFCTTQAQNKETADLSNLSSLYGYWEGVIDFGSFPAKQKMDIEIIGHPYYANTARVVFHHIKETGEQTDSLIIKPENGRLPIPFHTQSTKDQNKFCPGILYLSLTGTDNITGRYETTEKDCGTASYSGKRIKRPAAEIKTGTPADQPPAASAVSATGYTYSGGIQSEWIATGSSAAFTWFPWETAPAPLKEMAKKTSSWFDPSSDLNKQVLDVLKEQKDAKIEIALTDLDNDGILGLALRYNILRYPGQDVRDIHTVELYENAGTYSSDLVSVADWNVKPAVNGWRTADGRFYELAYYPGSATRYKTPAAIPSIFKPAGPPMVKKPEPANSVLQPGEYIYREVIPGEFGMISYLITIKKSGADFSFFFKTENKPMCDVTLKGILKKAGSNIYRYSEQSKGAKFGFTVKAGTNKFTVSNAACSSNDNEECEYCPVEAVYKLK